MVAKSLQALPSEVIELIPAKVKQGVELYGRGILQIVEIISLDQPSRWVYFYKTLETFRESRLGMEMLNNLRSVESYKIGTEAAIETAKGSGASDHVILIEFDVIDLTSLESLAD